MKDYDLHPEENKACCCGHLYGQHVIWGKDKPVGACPQIVTMGDVKTHCQCDAAHAPINHHLDGSLGKVIVTVTRNGNVKSVGIGYNDG